MEVLMQEDGIDGGEDEDGVEVGGIEEVEGMEVGIGIQDIGVQDVGAHVAAALIAALSTFLKSSVFTYSLMLSSAVLILFFTFFFRTGTT